MTLYHRIIVTNDLTARGFYMTDEGLESLAKGYNTRPHPVAYGHNYDSISNYLGSTVMGSAKVEKYSKGEGETKMKSISIDWNSFDTPSGQLYDSIVKAGAPMGASVGIQIVDYEFDEVSGLINIKEAIPYEYSETPIPTDDNTFAFYIVGADNDMLLASFSKWDTAYINNLPDSSFAVIEKDYKNGKIKDKNARHLPFKDADGSVDIPHLKNALARMGQIVAVGESETSEELRAKAKKVLIPYAKKHLPNSQWADNSMEGETMAEENKDVSQGLKESFAKGIAEEFGCKKPKEEEKLEAKKEDVALNSKPEVFDAKLEFEKFKEDFKNELANKDKEIADLKLKLKENSNLNEFSFENKENKDVKLNWESIIFKRR